MTEVLITFCLINHFQSLLPSVLPNSCKQRPPVENKIGEVKSLADKTTFNKRKLQENTVGSF